MVTVTCSPLVADRRNEVHVILGSLVEDVVQRCPVQLARLEVRCQRSLEGPEANDRIRSERDEERVDLRRGGHAATARIGAPVGGQLVRVVAGEECGNSTDVKVLALRCDGELSRGDIGEA